MWIINFQLFFICSRKLKWTIYGACTWINALNPGMSNFRVNVINNVLTNYNASILNKEFSRYHHSLNPQQHMQVDYITIFLAALHEFPQYSFVNNNLFDKFWPKHWIAQLSFKCLPYVTCACRHYAIKQLPRSKNMKLEAHTKPPNSNTSTTKLITFSTSCKRHELKAYTPIKRELVYMKLDKHSKTNSNPPFRGLGEFSSPCPDSPALCAWTVIPIVESHMRSPRGLKQCPHWTVS